MTITLETVNDEGYEVTLVLPSIKEVCPRCHGEGSHVNPSIDGNGITQSEMDELGDEFREDYFAGRFDVPCEECRGANVIDVVDEDRANPTDLALFRRHQDEMYELQAMEAAERRMGV